MVIALMVIAAIVLLYLLSNYVHGLATGGPTLFNNSSLSEDKENCATCDPDKDGLTNAEEVLWNTDPFNPDTDGDGFKDGEEVASGHNPLVPGPDDLIEISNLTEQLSNLTVGGLLTGELNPASDSYDQLLADITSSVMDSGKYIFNQKFDPGGLKVVLGNLKTNQTYAQQISLLIQQFSQGFGNQAERTLKDLNKIGANGFDLEIKTYYRNQANLFKTISEDAIGMAVPNSFAETHASFVSLARQMETINLAIAQGEEDIIKATLALQAVGEMPAKYLNFANSFVDVLLAEKIDINSITNSLK